MKDMNYFNDGNYRPENYRYVGKVNVPRKDAREILTGKCVYLDDFTLPQMLIGRALRSPYPHARIKSINIEKAAKMEGVVAILTYKDMDPNMKVGWPPTKPILGQELMYVGDPVALIAAETAEIANEAMTQIEVSSKRRCPSAVPGYVSEQHCYTRISAVPERWSILASDQRRCRSRV